MFKPDKHVLDGRDHARIGRLDLRRKHRRDPAVAADQILVEVPSRNFAGAFECSPSVERMRGRALDLGLGGEGKAHAIFAMSGLVDLGGAAGFLPAEVVRRHADDQETAVAVARPQLLQAAELRSVAALRGGVDDQDRLAGVCGERQVFAVETGEESPPSADGGQSRPAY